MKTGLLLWVEGLAHQTRVHLEVDEGDRLWVVKHMQLPNGLSQVSAASGEEAGGEQLDNQGSQIQTKDLETIRNQFSI